MHARWIASKTNQAKESVIAGGGNVQAKRPRKHKEDDLHDGTAVNEAIAYVRSLDSGAA